MQNTFSFIIMCSCIAVSLFCIYKIVTVQKSIIRFNYMLLLILSIFFSISFYNDYLSITVDVTKVDGEYLYYTYDNKEKRAEIDGKMKVKVGSKVDLYMKNKEYYLPNSSTKQIYQSISFLLTFLVLGVFIYTKNTYPDEFKNSGL